MNNLPYGVLPSDIPGERRRDQAQSDIYEEIIYLLNRAEEEGVDRLQVLMDVVTDLFPQWEVRTK